MLQEMLIILYIIQFSERLCHIVCFRSGAEIICPTCGEDAMKFR